MSTPGSDDIYLTAEGEEDGKPLIFRSLQAVPGGVREGDLPNLISISWPYEHNGSGMPDADTNDRQIDFEDALAPLDANDVSRLALVVTGNGRKEWHWYVRDVESWMDALNSLLADSPVLPLEITNDYESDWALHKNFLANVEGL